MTNELIEFHIKSLRHHTAHEVANAIRLANATATKDVLCGIICRRDYRRFLRCELSMDILGPQRVALIGRDLVVVAESGNRVAAVMPEVFLEVALEHPDLPLWVKPDDEPGMMYPVQQVFTTDGYPLVLVAIGDDPIGDEDMFYAN